MSHNSPLNLFAPRSSKQAFPTGPAPSFKATQHVLGGQLIPPMHALCSPHPASPLPHSLVHPHTVSPP